MPAAAKNPGVTNERPEILAVFSVGYRNRFGHPHPTVVARYAQARADLWRTDCEGAIHVQLAHGVSVRAYAENKRYWTDHESTHLPHASGLRGCGAAGADPRARR